VRRPSAEDTDLPVMLCPQPRHRLFCPTVVERREGSSVLSELTGVLVRSGDGGGTDKSGSRDIPPRSMAGSVGESGAHK
jgi:hypothetical protein